MLSAAPTAVVAIETPVRFRMEVTDTAGTPISTVEAGNEFAVNVYVVDQRSLPLGIFAAYLDVRFDDSRVVRSGEVTFGESYGNAHALGGEATGILDEVGAVASWFEIGDESAAVPETLLFRAPFRAIEAGPVTFLTEPADRLPDSYVLLFGVNQPVSQGQIAFDSASLNVTKSPPPAFSSTITLPETAFVSTSLSRVPSTSLFTPSLPILSTFDRGIEGDHKPRQLSKRFPTDDVSPHTEFEYTPRNAEKESGWIELPIRPAPVWQPLPLAASSYRKSLLPHDKDLLSFNSRTWELTSQTVHRDSRHQNWTRAFLRMNWSAQQVISLSSKDLLAARMIDIDEILTGAVGLELLESNLNEFFAKGLDDETIDSLNDDSAELLRSDIPLRAARGAWLAIEVGMASSEPSVAERSDIPEANADA